MPVMHPFPADIVLLHNFEGTFAPDVGEPFAVSGCTLTQIGAIYGTSLQGNGTTPGGGGPNMMMLAQASTTYDLSATDFTMEGWIRVNTQAFRPQWVLSVSLPDGTKEHGLHLNGGDNQLRQYVAAPPYLGLASVIGWASTGYASTNVVHHCAVTRLGNVVRLFLDGVKVSQGSEAFRYPAGPRLVGIAGQQVGGIDGLDGVLDAVCITKRCLYTDDFTPAGPYAGGPVLPTTAEAACRVWPAGNPQ